MTILPALPDIMTLEEAARQLQHLTEFKITKKTLYRAYRQGKLVCSKPGQELLVTADNLRKFITCPADKPAPASTSTPESKSGSSGTAPPTDGQDMAKASVIRLKQHLQSTSKPAAQRGEVVRLTPTN